MSETRLPRMLFVEDDPVIRRATADYLGRNGFDVVTAEDGDAGLLAWRSSEPVLALLDIMVPGNPCRVADSRDPDVGAFRPNRRGDGA